MKPIAVNVLFITTLLLGLCVVAYFLYLPGLAGPMVLDDFPQIGGIMETVNSGNWKSQAVNFIFSSSGNLGRPVSMLSFILDAVSHGDDLWYWKHSNLVLHLLTGLVLFWLTGVLSACQQGREASQGNWWLAFCVAGLWLLHPLQVSTVLYTVQRMAILSALFTSLGLLSYSLGRRRQLTGIPHGTTLMVLAFLLCFPLAALSKENGLLFPIQILLVEYCFFGFRSKGMTKIRAQAWIASGLAALGITAILMGGKIIHLVTDGYAFRPFTLTERLLTEARVMVTYLNEFLLPNQSKLGFYHDDFPISTGWLEPWATLPCALLLAGLVAVAGACRKRYPTITFGILFFFSCHLLESTVFPLELMFEHRNYLAIYGLVLVVTWLVGNTVGSTRLKAFCAFGAISMASVASANYIKSWSSAEMMYITFPLAHPNSPRLAIGLADRATNARLFQVARLHLSKHDGPGFRLQRLYVDCIERKHISDGQFANIFKPSDRFITTYETAGLINLANLGLNNQCDFSPAAFISLLSESLERNSDSINKPKLGLYKAHYQHMNKQFEEALQTLETTYALEPDNPIPLFLACEWKIDAGDLTAAHAYFRRAVAIANSSHKNYSYFIDPIAARLHSEKPLP